MFSDYNVVGLATLMRTRVDSATLTRAWLKPGQRRSLSLVMGSCASSRNEGEEVDFSASLLRFHLGKNPPAATSVAALFCREGEVKLLVVRGARRCVVCFAHRTRWMEWSLTVQQCLALVQFRTAGPVWLKESVTRFATS